LLELPNGVFGSQGRLARSFGTISLLIGGHMKGLHPARPLPGGLLSGWIVFTLPREARIQSILRNPRSKPVATASVRSAA
jgi:hypothetical protein